MKAKYLISAPIIYAVLIPLALLDLFTEIYHRVCFWLYGIPYVSREKYIRVDRHKLSYLNWFEKVNCAYCGYANGFAAYLVEIAGQTEKFWCGVKHQASEDFNAPKHHEEFSQYGDKDEFEKKYCN